MFPEWTLSLRVAETLVVVKRLVFLYRFAGPSSLLWSRFIHSAHLCVRQILPVYQLSDPRSFAFSCTLLLILACTFAVYSWHVLIFSVCYFFGNSEDFLVATRRFTSVVKGLHIETGSVAFTSPGHLQFPCILGRQVHLATGIQENRVEFVVVQNTWYIFNIHVFG